jgi:hypothetical protein
LLEIWYKITEQFTPEWGKSWSNYVERTGLKQLKRIVSLDVMLCSPIIDKYIDEDWKYNVKQDYLTDYFKDLNYLLSRIPLSEKTNLLAVLLSPTDDVSKLVFDKDFIFLGFDLIDLMTGISALTNCGGFKNSFNNSELSEDGLIKSFSRVLEIQESLKNNYPEEAHADCDIWAIWIKE